MAGTPNAATGYPLVLLLFFIIPAVWIFGIIRIGSSPRRLGLWTLPFVLFYSGLLFAVTVGAEHVGRYRLTVQFTDPQRSPLAGLPVAFDSLPFGDGLDRYAKTVTGSTTTDAEGRVSLMVHRSHVILFRVRRTGSEDATLEVGAAYGARHQIRSSDRDRSIRVLQPANAFWDPRSPSSGLLIPSNGDIAIQFPLPSK